jgi:hypothetical protein
VRSSVGVAIILTGIPFFYYWRKRSVASSDLDEVTKSGRSQDGDRF